MGFIRLAALGDAIRLEEIAVVGNSGRRGRLGHAHKWRVGLPPALVERG
jgi:hypothetical protein